MSVVLTPLPPVGFRIETNLDNKLYTVVEHLEVSGEWVRLLLRDCHNNETVCWLSLNPKADAAIEKVYPPARKFRFWHRWKKKGGV